MPEFNRPYLHDATQKLAAEFESPIQNDPQSLHRIKTPYSGNTTAEAKVSGLAAIIVSLGPGIHCMPDHPAVDSPERRRVSPPSNYHLAEQRACVSFACTHPHPIGAVQKQNIKLISSGVALA